MLWVKFSWSCHRHGIFEYCEDLTEELPSTDFFQVSMDEPNFNINCSRSLIKMETCNFYVARGSLKTGKVTLGWGLKKSWMPHTLSCMTVQCKENITQALAQLSIHVALCYEVLKIFSLIVIVFMFLGGQWIIVKHWSAYTWFA